MLLGDPDEPRPLPQGNGGRFGGGRTAIGTEPDDGPDFEALFDYLDALAVSELRELTRTLYRRHFPSWAVREARHPRWDR